MDSTLGAAALTVGAALLTTLWTAGGRATLERRAMREELGIASALPEGLARRRMEAVAEDRAALYVHRRVGSDHGARFHARMAVVVAVLVVGSIGLASVLDIGPTWVQFIVDIAFLAVLVLSGIAIAFWATESWRDHWADIRKLDLDAAAKRLAGVEGASDFASGVGGSVEHEEGR